MMENNKMNIVLCSDNNYVMPCGVTMISVLANNKNKPITFHIIGMGLKEESKERLSSISDKYSNVSILFYEIRKEFLESYNFSLYDSKHLSIAAYSRLFLGDILSKDIDKVLYLDCDMIITKDLSELWSINIENYSVAGVIDLNVSEPKTFEYLGYSSTFQYINSGMLLINLKYWREHDLIKVFLDYYIEKHDKLIFHDQDIINGTLYETTLLLPIKYNVIDYYYLSKRKDFPNYQEELFEAMTDPVVIHYTSINKPWLKSCLHPLKKEFLKYKGISPWKKVPLSWGNLSLSRKIRYYKRVILYTLGLKKPKYLVVKKDSKSGKYRF